MLWKGFRSCYFRTTSRWWAELTTLMQFQSDILGILVVRSEVTETNTPWSAFLAGLEADMERQKD